MLNVLFGILAAAALIVCLTALCARYAPTRDESADDVAFWSLIAFLILAALASFW